MAECVHKGCVGRRSCRSAWARDHYEAHKEEILAVKRAYYEARRGQLLAQKRAYYEANKEKVVPRMRAYREANKEKLAAWARAYREAHKEEIAVYQTWRRPIKSAARAERAARSQLVKLGVTPT